MIVPFVYSEALYEEQVKNFRNSDGTWRSMEYDEIKDLPVMDSVIRETLRLIPPVHSSIRVATQDDIIPTSTPVKLSTPDGGYEEADSFLMPKGSCVHVPIEAFNLDREVWGPDGWQFK